MECDENRSSLPTAPWIDFPCYIEHHRTNWFRLFGYFQVMAAVEMRSDDRKRSAVSSLLGDDPGPCYVVKENRR